MLLGAIDLLDEWNSPVKCIQGEWKKIYSVHLEQFSSKPAQKEEETEKEYQKDNIFFFLTFKNISRMLPVTSGLDTENS